MKYSVTFLTLITVASSNPLGGGVTQPTPVGTPNPTATPPVTPASSAPPTLLNLDFVHQLLQRLPVNQIASEINALLKNVEDFLPNISCQSGSVGGNVIRLLTQVQIFLSSTLRRSQAWPNNVDQGTNDQIQGVLRRTEGVLRSVIEKLGSRAQGAAAGGIGGVSGVVGGSQVQVVRTTLIQVVQLLQRIIGGIV